MVQQFDHDSARFWNVFGIICCVRILQQHGGFITLLWSEEEEIAEVTMYPDRVQTVTTSTKFQN